MSQTKAELINAKGGADLGALNIDGSAPDNSVNLDASGRLLVGTSTSLGDGSPFQVVNDSANPIEVFRGQDAAFGPAILFNKSRNSTASPTVVSSGDEVGAIVFKGYSDTASAYIDAALIRAEIDGAPDSGGDTTDMPGRLVFSTTADGASSPTPRMTVYSDGNVTIGSTAQPILRLGSSVNAGSGTILSRIIGRSDVYGSDTSTIDFRGGDSGYSDHSTIYFETTGFSGKRPAIQLRSSQAVQFPYISTTASAANAFLDSSGSNNLLRSTSSLRYKTDIENLECQRADAILNFRPVWYRSTAEADRNEWSWYGLIAEEVAEIEPRLVHWTYLEGSYEEVDGERQLKPGAELVPDGVQYDRLTVLLLDVVQRQQKRIETLEAKVATLDAS